MGYQMHYATTENIKRLERSKQRKKVQKIFLILLVVTVTVVLLRYSKQLQDFLIPGNEEITRLAAKQMITNLKEGQPLRDAVSIFCDQILTNEIT